MRQKKIAVIQDLAGVGRCSLTVALPIISAMKIQCCPVITSILSNHTGFSHCYLDDYTDKMPEYISHWKQLGLEFDGIYSGYLGSKKQLDIVIDFFQYFSKNNPIIIVDPIMGDNGRLYQNFDEEMCQAMKQLVSYASLITPNLTETCKLTDVPYKEKWTRDELFSLADRLHELGPQKVVITGIKQGRFINNLVSQRIRKDEWEQRKNYLFDLEEDWEGEKETRNTLQYEEENGTILVKKNLMKSRHVGVDRPGTGDIFTSILAAGAVQGHDLEMDIRKAVQFIKKCLWRSELLDIPVQEGVCFEEFLTTL